MFSFLKPPLIALWLLACLPLSALEAPPPAQPPAESFQFLSDPYRVDRVYRSMQGPASTKTVRLHEDGPRELLWVTGYHTEIVGEDGKQRVNQDFMCHSNLDVPDPAVHGKPFGKRYYMNSRLFTVSQGLFGVDMPPGYGIPIMSDEPLQLNTQVLNLSPKTAIPFTVRHRVSISYVRDSQLRKPMKPLMTYSAFGLASSAGEARAFGVKDSDEKTKALSCIASTPASESAYKDWCGANFTGHWVVKPGREVNHTLVSQIMGLPYDTTVQYIAVHLHPYAESLELRDVTTNTTVFKSNARNFPDRIGLDKVETYSSPEGIKMFKDHVYDMISIYNNTTGENQDSMAVMYLYMLDKEFKKPAPAAATVTQP